MQDRILIRNGRIWTGREWSAGDVLLDRGRVAAVGGAIDVEAGFEYDAGGAVISAGLVDIHMHMRGVSSDKYGIPAESVSFPFGVTAAADGSGLPGGEWVLDTLLLHSAVFVCCDIVGDRADVAQSAALLELYGDRAVGLKLYLDTEVSDVRSIRPVREAVAFARARGLRVMVHCTGSPVPALELAEALAPGDIITHAYHGPVHDLGADGFAAMRLARRKGIIMDAGMAGGVHTDFALLRRAIGEGLIPDVISTDITCFSAFKRGGRYGLTQCMSMLRHLGMEEDDVLRAVTSGAASALGKEDVWGILEPGRTADLAVLEWTDVPFDITDRWGGHIASREGYRCLLTVCGGRVVFRA